MFSRRSALSVAGSVLLPRIAIAQGDDARAPGDKDALRTATDAAKRPAEIEVYPASHGWCVMDSPVYDAAQAERAWVRLLALYKSL